ncbi:MAG: PspC domain-containing protein [Bacteroidia bacterium]
MNRTITMNLSGIIFHIEEDAYEMLNKYLATIKSYFNDAESRDEIMSDIEGRIAELLQEKVSTIKQAILLQDVNAVIALMGKPEEFAGDNQQTDFKQAEQENTHQQPTNKAKRVFRDTDNKILGGVCSGVANYFDFDPIWLRALFAISFFAFGSGLLLYIILWIIIPEAKTTAEKLEMRGEKVDINSISKVVKDELNDLKNRANKFGDEMGSKETKDRLKYYGDKLFEFVRDTLYNLIRIVAKIVAVFFVFIAIILLVVLLAGIFGNGSVFSENFGGNSINFSLFDVSTFILPKNLPNELVSLALLLFIGVPLLSIIYSCIKHLFGIKEKNKIVKYMASTLWLFGLALTVYMTIEISNEFSQQAYSKESIKINQPINETLYLDAKTIPNADFTFLFNQRNRKIDFYNKFLFSKTDSTFSLGYPTMEIVESETDSFQLVVIKSARGFDKKQAIKNAKNITYSTTQKDSTLILNSYYDINTEDQLRFQKVKIILKVPLNKVIYLSKRMEKIIYDVDNVSNTWDNDMVDRRWVMTSHGLQCIDCSGLDDTENNIPLAPTPPTPPPTPSRNSKVKNI